MFEPIRTDRLLLRPFRAEDAAALATRRNHPDVASHQNWELPYTDEQADALVADLLTMRGPRDGEWWMAAIADSDDSVVYGDLAVHLSWQGRAAEIGFTLARDYWGNGYAAEAVACLLPYLFDGVGVTRVQGVLHPDNVASAMVLERTGFVFEGHTRLSHWVGDENSDDYVYGLTRADWDAWRNRPTTPPAEVRLEEIGYDESVRVFRLETHKSQQRFVATMEDSFADALFPELVDGHPAVPWLRSVVADGETVAFVMLAVTTEHHPEPYLWRLLVDRLHQRRGIGTRILDLVVAECWTQGDRTLLTSWTEGRGSPRPFYEAYGFVPTGNLIEGETEARLHFDG